MIYAENGIAGLYKGATIRMMYLCVGGFAFFGMYEQFKKLIVAKMENLEREEEEKKK